MFIRWNDLTSKNIQPTATKLSTLIREQANALNKYGKDWMNVSTETHQKFKVKVGQAIERSKKLWAHRKPTIRRSG
jgi:hypothetical protein